MSHLGFFRGMLSLAADLSEHPLTGDAWLLCGVLFLLGAAWDFASRFEPLGFRPPQSGSAWIIRFGWVLLTALLALQGLRRHELPIGTGAELLLTIGWGLGAVALFLDLTFEHRLPAWAIGLAVAACLFAAGWLGLDVRPIVAQEKPLIGVHVGAAVLAYCVIGALVLNSAAYLLQDRALARRKFGGIYSLLPALVPLDRIGSQLLGAAVWLLGLSLVIGAADWAQRVPALVGVPKLAAALVTWAWCLIILVRRRRGTLSGSAFAAAALGVAVPAAIAFWLSLPSR
jgi:ABC-type uncharacterized transport system permease subunit